MQMHIPAFMEGGPIPKVHTADGTDYSPEMEWSGVPPGTKSFVIICDDPDAPHGTWVHWVMFNIPADVHHLNHGIRSERSLPNGTKQGINDFQKIGYGGPAPPPGKPHRYFFKLYALDIMLDLTEGATKAHVETAMKGHILAETKVMGKYSR